MTDLSNLPRSLLAMTKFINTPWQGVCLDLGCGDDIFKQTIEESAQNRKVETITRRKTLANTATYFGNFLYYEFVKKFDAVWCSHVLEHQVEPYRFLRQIKRVIKPGGLLAIIVPAPRTVLASGHINEYTIGLLVYNMVIAGFDCSDACVYQSNTECSIVVRVKDAKLPQPNIDDDYILEDLNKFFPVDAYQYMPAVISNNWEKLL
jgi:SAM-dependent methyltransferase